MKTIFYILTLLSLISCTKTPIDDTKKPPTDSVTTERRNPYRWPFSESSIWNMPIGSKAVYVAANLEPASRMTVDEDYIVMTPTEPLMKIYTSNVGWGSGDRCVATGPLLFEAPIPQSWEVSRNTWDGTTPNAGLAVLMTDKRTIKQTQPFAHCTIGGDATSTYSFPDQDIYGDGLYGAHGGSGLSAVGGALRYDELTTTSGPIRHVLKMNVYAAKNLYYDETTKGFRWPAKTADSNASSVYGKLRTTPSVKACRMGALLAIPNTIDINTLNLETQPAKILAQALQDYGAYIVDDTAWDVNAFITEWGPDGRFKVEFEKNWGFTFTTDGSNAWGKDLKKIMAALHVVDNNSESFIGGGGIPRKALAPPFMKMN